MQFEMTNEREGAPLQLARGQGKEEEEEEEEASAHAVGGGSSSASSSTQSAQGDVSSLLNFVHTVSTDIQAVLDRSAPCKRSVDHRKYLQKQLRRYSADAPSEAASPSGSALSLKEDVLGDVAHMDGASRRDVINARDVSDAENVHNGTTYHAEQRLTSSLAAAMTSSKTVPLRQRQLPASFWQEPNQPRTEKVPILPGSVFPVPFPMANGYDPRTLDPAAYCGPYPNGCVLGLRETRAHGGCTPDMFLSSAYYQKYPECAPFYPWSYGLPLNVEDKISRTTLLSLDSVYNKPYPRPVPDRPLAPSSWEGPTLPGARQGVWRPIPTKTLASLSTHRYHPFTDVR